MARYLKILLLSLIVFNCFAQTTTVSKHKATTWLSVGDTYGGGKVAYILQAGDPGYVANTQHGLIAATADQGTAVTWWLSEYVVTSATGTALGTGSANTTAIITVQGNTGSYAAKICRDYAGGGFTDWYLPSSVELSKLYTNRVAIGGFDTEYYWSSTETYLSTAHIINFTDGTTSDDGYKDYNMHVRAVRSF